MPRPAAGRSCCAPPAVAGTRHGGEPARELHPGDVVVIPPQVKHWHGAARDSWFAHLAVEVPGTETSNEWCEPVSAEEYDALP